MCITEKHPLIHYRKAHTYFKYKFTWNDIYKSFFHKIFEQHNSESVPCTFNQHTLHIVYTLLNSHLSQNKFTLNEVSDRASLVQRSNQQDATTCSFTNLLNQPFMFRTTDSPILRSTSDCIYSFWYNAPTMLPIGATVEMELHSFSTLAPIGSIVPKAVYTVKSAPEDGRICRLKHVGLI